jgi:serine/threonine protein kinase
MLTKGGVKLLDFGLAKALPSPPGRGAWGEGLTSLPTFAGSSPLTQEGTILGTFQYMAPEQLEGKEADTRTDIFAFGAVLRPGNDPPQRARDRNRIGRKSKRFSHDRFVGIRTTGLSGESPARHRGRAGARGSGMTRTGQEAT